MVRPEFSKNYEQFYPVKTFEKIGFHRANCEKCGHYYWRRSEKKTNCGDANCAEKYHFIGTGVGLGKKGKYLSYSDAWKNFEKAFNSARIPCTTIDRYPTVARWRADVDFCAAGIYCFQPYCMTGELDPPANPLICPQFCVRFNDLDNIGITGRHYSGFIMLGIQVFNKKDNFIFFKEEVVEFNYRWLTEFLEIDPEEITFIEDVWCGGGNLGPCIEYFIGGLEVGNMVFIEYKTFHDGSREKLEVQVVDVGIGLERVSWFVNGNPTSYNETFKNALDYLSKQVQVETRHDIWEKFGPYSSMLNIDEVEDIDETWKKVASLCGEEVDVIKKAVAPVKDMYVILDHTRTLFMTIYDGSLPSNVGGGGNIRNIFRRVLAILHKNDWWKKLGLDGLMAIIEFHKLDLERIYGDGHFKPNESIRKVLALEIEKWETTDINQRDLLKKILDKKKGTLELDDWILAMQSWGVPADKISQISGLPIPGNLYYEIAKRIEQQIPPSELHIYDTNHLPATECLYYDDHKQEKFEGKIVDVFLNLGKEYLNKRNIVILDKSAFYPTSGGQLHDTGLMEIKGETYKVVNCEKVGNCTLHILDKEVPEGDLKGVVVLGKIDMDRRKQLMAHHTGTHIVFAAARKILGPHVWQNGAKKTLEKAHLDITHFQSLTYEDELAIENEANRIIMNSIEIKKYFLNKKKAELDFGFTLYQGGVVPGNNLRIVQIEGTDVEACCGTHCDNTAEVGWVKMNKSHRISDGIVRLEYVAYERALEELNGETSIINTLCKDWNIEKNKIVQTGNRFFHEFKKYENQAKKKNTQILALQFKAMEFSPEKLYFHISDHDNPTFYFSNLKEEQARILKKTGKGVIYVGNGFIFGLIGNKDLYDENKFKNLHELAYQKELAELEKEKEKKLKEVKESDTNEPLVVKITKPKTTLLTSIGKKKEAVDGIILSTYIYDLNVNYVAGLLKDQGFIEI